MKLSRIISLFLALMMLLVMICSCNHEEKPEKYKDGVIGARETGIFEGLYEVADGIIGGKEYSKAAEGRYEAEVLTPTAAEFYPEPGTNTVQPTAGLLTAGESRDISKLDEWLETYIKENFDGFYKQRGLYSTNIVPVKVQTGTSSVFNQKAELYSDSDELLYTATTDINGEAFLFYSDAYANNLGYVKVNGEKQDVIVGNKTEFLKFDLNLKSGEIKELDLMLMVDTTGSMGDELEYLKAELVDMVGRISESKETLSIRVSVNFYRDEGDEYIVKYYDFRTDINECLSQIKEQSAQGGGDYPEAVHTALENAVTGHTWRENAVKICFFVLDAPPHTESEIQGINSSILKSVTKAAELGIRIIPVASSGVDKDTEYILRSFALMTGGTYIFLTNHSGIGGSHIDPSVSDYTVEPLNECMIRVVCEYCGLEYVSRYTYTEKPVEQQ